MTVGIQSSEVWWDGRVRIDVLKTYPDDRGSLTEVWRTDDSEMGDECPYPPVMSYWSTTKPYVLRGPHEHKDQTDWFITWNAKMMYILYDKETGETRTFITDPDVVTRVKVEPGVVHSYRNLEHHTITTGNFPSSLFMGEGKEEPIDEIRWEDKIENQPYYVVLGQGRLGKAVSRAITNIDPLAASRMVIIDRSLYNDLTIDETFDKLQGIKLNKPSDVHVINCMASTDVANSSGRDSWNNFTLPCFLFDQCSYLNYKFYHISTDYVYQDMNYASPYSHQKKKAEDSLLQRGNQDLLKILRVANLVDPNDERPNNIVKKLWAKVQEGGTVHYDPSYRIYPSDVDVLAKHIVETAFTTDAKISNYVSPPYTIDDFVRKFFQYENLQEANYPIPSWHDKYETDEECDIIKVPSSESQIRDYVSKLIEGV